MTTTRTRLLPVVGALMAIASPVLAQSALDPDRQGVLERTDSGKGRAGLPDDPSALIDSARGQAEARHEDDKSEDADAISRAADRARAASGSSVDRGLGQVIDEISRSDGSTTRVVPGGRDLRADQESLAEFLDRVRSGASELKLSGPSSGKGDPATGYGDTELLVFASFSIPDESLKRLMLDTERAGGKLIMRGMHEESLQKTAAKVREVMGDDESFSFQIDPRPFQMLGVETVPTFALVEDTSAHIGTQCAKAKGVDVCQTDADPVPAAVIVGEVSLRYALDQIKRRAAEWSGVAAAYLANLDENDSRERFQ